MSYEFDLLDANSREVRNMSKPHIIECYCSPCIHWDSKIKLFVWFCTCGESLAANRDYAPSLFSLRTHQVKCMGADPPISPPPTKSFPPPPPPSHPQPPSPPSMPTVGIVGIGAIPGAAVTDCD